MLAAVECDNEPMLTFVTGCKSDGFRASVVTLIVGLSKCVGTAVMVLFRYAYLMLINQMPGQPLPIFESGRLADLRRFDSRRSW